MAIRNYKPTTPGRRKMSTLINDEITKATPEKSLTVTLKKNSGRNNQGKITTRHQGGRVKRKYRIIDFKRNKLNVPGVVASIEYDPNRTANIALINYVDGEKRYIIAPKNLTVGTRIEAGENVDIIIGNALPLMNIPVGTVVHNIELRPGKGGELARSAGSSAQILGREGKYVMIRLTSGEQRLSNYLLWQLAYSEFYFTDIPWPAFTKEELIKAVEEYNRRHRRFGGVEEAE